MDEGQEVGSELIVANGNSAELLKLEKEFFHKMAFLVEPPVDKPRIRVIRLGRDAEVRIVVSDKLAELPLAVGSVRKDGCAFQVNPAEQFFRNRDIAGIAGGQHDLNRVAQGIHNGVNLRASAATADSNALIGLRLVLAYSCLLGGRLYGFGRI